MFFALKRKLINGSTHDHCLIKEMLFSTEFAICLQNSVGQEVGNFHNYFTSTLYNKIFCGFVDYSFV